MHVKPRYKYEDEQLKQNTYMGELLNIEKFFCSFNYVGY
ncbi:hypothetical protein EW15_2198 [Prochlorococcus sp. MIT 0801]|nr:hypothetical protein EW15_2198 [Prochlorococcus sp. MIT 0801]